MRIKASMLLALVGLLGWTSGVWATPLEPKQVAAEAKWLAHLDVDTAKTSPVVLTVVKECLDPCMDKEECREMKAEEWGFNPAKDLHGMTLYGTEHGPRHAVALIQVQVDQEKCLKHLGKKVELQTTEHQGTKIYSWTKCFGGWEHHRAMAFYKDNLVVFARSTKLVEAALDVLDGETANLSGKDSPLTAKTPDGTIFFLRATGLEDVKWSPILKSLSSIDYVVSEQKEQWTKHLTVVATSEEVANRLKTVGEGWRALLSLLLQDHPEIVKLLNRAQFSVEGKTVQAKFEAPDQEVIAQIPTICKLVHEHLERHHAMHHEMHHHWMHEQHEKDND